VPPYELRRHGVEALLSIVLHRRDRLIVTVGVPGIDTCLIEVRGTEVPRGEEREKWIVDYLDQDGKRHVETFDRKKAAVDREAKVRIDIGKGIHVASSNSITVAEAADRWLRNVEANGRERSTLRQYQQHVKHHIVPRIGRIKLAKLTATTVENFRNQLLGNGNGGEGALSRPLARKVLTSLKSLLKTAKYSHVAADVKIDSSKRQQRLEPGRDFPALDEVKRLVEAAKTPRQRALLLTVALTGLRASELRGLRWRDVELERGEDRLVFPTATGHAADHANLLRGLAPVMTAAGVVENGEPKYAMHAFRHFFASWCINPKKSGGRELPAKAVQHLLGHSSIVMTLDTYGHLFPNAEDRAELAQATQALLGGPTTGEVVPLAVAKGEREVVRQSVKGRKNKRHNNERR
jgi:integrase